MRKSFKNLMRLGLFIIVAAGASACVVDPGYGYGPGYYGGPNVVVAPGPVYYGGGYYHGGYGYHRWH